MAIGSISTASYGKKGLNKALSFFAKKTGHMMTTKKKEAKL